MSIGALAGLAGVLLEEGPELGGELVPLGPDDEVVCLVIVPDVEPLVAPEGGGHLGPAEGLFCRFSRQFWLVCCLMELFVGREMSVGWSVDLLVV